MGRIERHHWREKARSALASAEWAVLAAGLIAIPLWISASGRDAFRTPKLLLLRGEGILLVAIAALTALVPGSRDNPRNGHSAQEEHTWWPRIAVGLPLAIGGWTIVAAVAPPRQFTPIPSLITVLAGVAIYFGASRNAWRAASVWIIFPAPVAIAVVALLQTNPRWNGPMLQALIGGVAPEMLPRVSPVSLLGNRNDVGSYLIAPLLCAAALVHLLPRGSKRTMSTAAALVLAAGIVASMTVTALIALGASLIALVWRCWRRGGLILLVAAILAASSALAFAPLRQRAHNIGRTIAAGDWDALLTFRLVAFLAAGEMVAGHPLTGVGPGMFKREYFDHRILAAQRHGGLLHAGGSTDVFEEAHNDHLQVAAESGVIGYALFAAALIAFAAISWRRDSSELASSLAFPLAVSLCVLALAQSPLQRAVTIASYSYLAGVCSGWRRDGLV